MRPAITRIRRPIRLVLVGAVLTALLVVNINRADAVHDLGLFELEGNLADNSGAPLPDDWVTLQASGGSAKDFTDVLQDRVNDSTYFSGGGSKDTLDVTNWGSNGSSSPPKDEITNAYAAGYTSGAGHHIVYFGVDRGATNGDSQMGFWFFQNSVSVAGSGFDGTHVARDTANGIHGDLLVLSDFTKGGKVGSVKVYEWVNGGGSDGNLDLIFSESGSPSPQCGASAADEVCAIENGASVPVPSGWSYAGSTFSTGAFLEGGLDITALFPDSNACFASFQAETRSSQSPSATLKDFVTGSFESCFPTTSLSASAASAATIHKAESSTVTFTETNDGNVPLSAPANGFLDCAANNGATAGTPVYVSGDDGAGDSSLANNGILDPDEAWVFTCTVSTAANTVAGTITVTGTGHGIDPNDGHDVTWCTDANSPPAGVTCDQDERATATFTVVNPSTTMTSSVSAVVTYNFDETNNGDTPLTRADATAANNFVRSSDCTISEKLSTGTTFNVGDTDHDGVLDVGETWSFTCTRTLTAVGSYTTVAKGHGTDSATSPKDVRWCTASELLSPPSGVFCDQDELQSITVGITKP